jgi:uncharacterized protein
MLEEALEHLVKGIVEHPDDVRVNSHGLRTVIGSLAGGKYVRVDLLDVDEVR